MSQLPNPFMMGLTGLGALPPLPSLTGPQQPARPRDPSLEPLDPAEQEGLLERIGKGALGGLAYLGGSLGKALGGRAIRGALAGRPDELLSIIPFSDTLGITDPSREAHGAEILGNKDAPFLSPQGLGGFGLEVLTDPASYLTFGASALTKAGRIAKAAGVLPETVAGRATSTLGKVLGEADAALQAAPTAGRALQAGADVVPFAEKARIAAEAAGIPLQEVMGHTLGGVAGFRFPFMEPTGIMGAGAGGKAFMDVLGGAKSLLGSIPGVEQVGNVLAPIGRSMKALFQPQYMGAAGEAAQKVAPGVYKARQEVGEAVRGRAASLIQQAEKEGKLGWQEGQRLRAMAEGQIPMTAADQDLVEKIIAFKNDAHANAVYQGFEPHLMEDPAGVEHLPREMRFADTGLGRAGQGKYQTFQTDFRQLGEREEILKGVPKGTGQAGVVDPTTGAFTKGTGLEGIRTDPRIYQGTPATAADIIREEYLGMDAAAKQRMGVLASKKTELDKWAAIKGHAATMGLTPAQIQSFDALAAQSEKELAELAALTSKATQADKLADFYRTTVPREGMLGFTHHPIDDVAHYSMTMGNRAAAGNGIWGLIKNSAVDIKDAGPGAVPVMKLLDDVGLKHTTRLDRLTEVLGSPVAAAGKMIPAEAAADAMRYMQGFTRPEALSPVLDAIDYMTKLFKGAVTSLWPSYHARNMASNMWMNSVEGALSRKSMSMAHSLLSGETVEGASKLSVFKGMNMTDEQATQAIQRMAYQYRVAGEHSALSAAELVDTSAELLGKLPGKIPNTFESMGQAFVGKTLPTGLPVPVPGVAQPAAPGWWESPYNPLNPRTFGPNVAGRKLGTRIEETSRLSGFIELMDQGIAPEVAATRIRAAQVDYGQLTQFEKTVMRRLIPFYTYSRIAIPYQIEQLMQRPGGLLGTAIKAAGEARGVEPGFLPDYLKNTVALPVGEPGEEGTQRYLSQLGLPFEDLSQNLSVRGMLGGLNPYLKAPLELATGQQFFSGRKLADLYSPTGNPITDQLIYNSPVARVASTASNVADPRKGLADMLLHTLSGVRLTDVDMAKAKNVAVRDYLDQAMRGPEFKRFESIYVKPEDLPNLSPPELELLRLYVARQRAAQQLSRQQGPR